MVAMAVCDVGAPYVPLAVGLPRIVTTAKQMGAALKALRESRGVTQYAVADRMGVEVDAVRHWEAGRRRFRAEQIPDLARALGVSILELSEHIFTEDIAEPRPTLVDRVAELVGPERAHMVGQIVTEIEDLSSNDQDVILRSIRAQVAGFRILSNGEPEPDARA